MNEALRQLGETIGLIGTSVNNLNTQYSENTRLIDAILKLIGDGSKFNDLKEEILRLREEINKLKYIENELIAVKKAKEECEIKLKEITEAKNASDQELKTSGDEIQRLKNILSELEKKQTIIENEKTDAVENITRFKGDLDAINASINTATENVGKDRSKINEIIEKLNTYLEMNSSNTPVARNFQAQQRKQPTTNNSEKSNLVDENEIASAIIEIVKKNEMSYISEVGKYLDDHINEIVNNMDKKNILYETFKNKIKKFCIGINKEEKAKEDAKVEIIAEINNLRNSKPNPLNGGKRSRKTKKRRKSQRGGYVYKENKKLNSKSSVISDSSSSTSKSKSKSKGKTLSKINSKKKRVKKNK
jgi:predicted  nucleic acid-binding Zn-ribbon protein